jgi:hypothetical protein
VLFCLGGIRAAVNSPRVGTSSLATSTNNQYYILCRCARKRARKEGAVSYWPPSGRKHRGKAIGAYGPPDLPAQQDQDTGAAIRVAAEQLSLSACVARNEPHVGYPISQAFQNGFTRKPPGGAARVAFASTPDRPLLSSPYLI